MTVDFVVGTAAAVVFAGFVGVAVARRWRDRERITGLQRLVDERLSGDPALAGCSVRARVHRGWMGEVEVELCGEVPSVWQRYAASRVVERELARREVRSVVVDRVTVMWQRPVPRHRHSA